MDDIPYFAIVFVADIIEDEAFSSSPVDPDVPVLLLDFPAIDFPTRSLGLIDIVGFQIRSEVAILLTILCIFEARNNVVDRHAPVENLDNLHVVEIDPRIQAIRGSGVPVVLFSRSDP